ncbi:MAG: uracil-DNA glycosylase [Oscillospiraceae bacterium]
MMERFGNEWDALLGEEFEKDYFQKLEKFLEKEYAEYTIFPPKCDIFNALALTSYSDVKVVILGQDPYHEVGQSYGLCFSVKEGISLPPSLRNIFKELTSDLGILPPKNGTLTKWASGGVLLLNTVLTVREGQANSHKNVGWEIFTDRVISLLNGRKKPVIFLLWGANARAKAALIGNPQHKILQCAHPSPLSAYNGFFGCKHFSQANEFLKSIGETPINWDLND